MSEVERKYLPVYNENNDSNSDDEGDLPPKMNIRTTSRVGPRPSGPSEDVGETVSTSAHSGDDENDKWSKEKRILISVAVFCVLLFALVYMVNIRLSTSLLITLTGTFLLGWWMGYMSKERGYNCT
jgi:Flp pilus assembly protein TadB